MTGRPKVFFRSEVWEKNIWRHFEDISEKKKLDWSWVRRNSMSDWRNPIGWYEGVAQNRERFEHVLALSQFYISQLKRWCFKSISRMSSVRNELESCSELFIHITGWSDSKKYYWMATKNTCWCYLQSRMGADSRELINRKFDFCQVNLQTSFQCTIVIPVCLNIMFESHRWQIFFGTNHM